MDKKTIMSPVNNMLLNFIRKVLLNVPKYRKKVLYGNIRREMDKIVRQLCRQKDIELLEGKAMPDHMHMLLSVLLRYSIAMTLGYLKGKSVIQIHRDLSHYRPALLGLSFWACGYSVSAVGFDEASIRQYTQEQEQHERAQERPKLD